ncbi:MAG: DNA primase [Ktedonobacterales bacterium]
MADTLSVIERIKQKLDIVEEIGAVVPLKKSGKAFKGLCPFHGERTPSFYVFPETGTWRCFGCNEGGDIFTFVEKQQGLEFRDVLAQLAERAGIALESGLRDGDLFEESAETSARKRLRTLNEAAAIWFHHQLLQAPEAQYARSYLDSRGVSNESIALWRLGYAPDGDRLSVYLQAQGYSVKELVEAGFSREREPNRGGGVYDYFRNRVIFPIRDGRGQTIAFGGRELGGGTPKYLNSPQTVIFDKSATLYGLDLARDGIKRANKVVIVEGYMDVILPHQYGFRNVVACIGSAITEKHIRQIKKLTRRVALALDPDAAGESATLRGITVAQQAFDRMVVPVPSAAEGAPRNRKGEPKGMVRFEEQVDAEITVVRLPPHEDPDEFVRRDQAGWQSAVDQAQPLIDFLIEAQTADLALDTPRGKIEATRRLLPIIAEVRDRTLADDYVGRLAARIRLDKVDLRRDLAQARQRLDREARQRAPREEAPDEASAEEQRGETVEHLGGKYQERGGDPSDSSYSASGEVRTGTRTGIAARLLAELAQEEECLGLLLEQPSLWTEMQGIVSEGDFSGTETRAVFQAFAALARARAGAAMPDARQVLEALPEELQPVAQRARERITSATAADDDAPDVHALASVASRAAYRLKRARLKEEMAELDYLERDAEQSNDAEALRALLKRKLQLLSQRRALDAASGLMG